MPVQLQLRDNRSQVFRPRPGTVALEGPPGRPLFSREHNATISPKPLAARFRSRKGLLGSITDHTRLKLRYGGHLLKHEAPRWAFDLWEITEADLNSGLEE